MTRRVTALKPKIVKSSSHVEKSKIPTITPFADKVYTACKSIPPGKVATYATIASMIGSPKAVQAVGSALKRNPFAPVVPCHRVIASDYSLGGFYGSKDPNGDNLKRKYAMLKAEGVTFTVEADGKSIVQSSCVHQI